MFLHLHRWYHLLPVHTHLHSFNIIQKYRLYLKYILVSQLMRTDFPNSRMNIPCWKWRGFDVTFTCRHYTSTTKIKLSFSFPSRHSLYIWSHLLYQSVPYRMFILTDGSNTFIKFVSVRYYWIKYGRKPCPLRVWYSFEIMVKRKASNDKYNSIRVLYFSLVLQDVGKSEDICFVISRRICMVLVLWMTGLWNVFFSLQYRRITNDYYFPSSTNRNKKWISLSVKP